MVQMNRTKERYLENEFVEIWFEKGIVFEIFKPNTHLTMEAARKIVADRMRVSGGVTTPMYVDIRNLVTADLEVHKYMASKEAVQCISAGAFLVRGLIDKMLMHIFVTIFKPAIPAAPFTDKEQALEWLQKYKFLN